MKRFPLLAVGVFLGCQAAPPTGTASLSETTMAVTCGLDTRRDTHKVHVEELYDCSVGSSEDCEDAWLRTLTGAEIEIARAGSVYTATPVDWWYPYYKVTIGSIEPGQTFRLTVNHPDYEPVWSEITVPDSVHFTLVSLDSLTEDVSTLRFEWSPASNAEGYDSHLFLVVETDSVAYSAQLNDYFQEEAGYSVASDFSPSRETWSEFEPAEVIRQVSFIVREDIPEEIILNAEQAYLILKVFSLDEGYYYSKLRERQPDEYSGFSAPLIQYSNIENGVGVFGSFWVTNSSRVAIDESLIEQYLLR